MDFPREGTEKKFCSQISGNFRIRASNRHTHGNLAQGTEQMAIFFSFEGYPGQHGKKLFFQSFGWLSMQNDLEHLGNDLGIDGKSYTSSSLSSNSDSESSSSSSLSDKSEECVILLVISSGSACLLQSTSIQNYFMKQPKPSHSSLPHATVENADEPSTRAVKVWSDPLKAKDRSSELKKGVCARNQISEDSNVFLGISLIFTLDRAAQIWHKLKQELLCNDPRGHCIVESSQEEGYCECCRWVRPPLIWKTTIPRKIVLRLDFEEW